MRFQVLFFAFLLAFMAMGPMVVRADDDVLVAEDVEEPAAPQVTPDDDVVEEEEEEEPVDPLLSSGFSEDQLTEMKDGEESFEFQAEVNRLMDIIINSLYSNRDIFVRELISNSADALDKIRYASLTDEALLGENTELDIKISFDKDAKTLTFHDTGIGMTKEELIKNLGVVAKSGTTEFVQEATKTENSDNTLNLIGQFGVGFYSVYLAADKVTVISKNPNDDQYIWESTADSVFTIVKDPRGNTLGRGTQVILHMKEDAEEFLNEGKLKKIIGRYSEFINFPISLEVDKTIEVEEEITYEDEEAEDEDDEEDDDDEETDEDDDFEVTDEDDEVDDGPKFKTVKKTIKEFQVLNIQKAIWTRSKDDITEEQYNKFFHSLKKNAKDDEAEPLNKIHFSAEGEISFRSILYIPSEADTGMYDKYYEKASNLKLYVRRVLISDEFDDFLPRYLNFIRGVVDSEDLPLNVSRETLAESRVLKVMSKKLTRKVLEMLRKMAAASEEAMDEAEEADDEDDEEDEGDADDDDDEDEDDEKEEEGEEGEKRDDYITFWEAFGKSIKLGMIDDRSNKSKLTKLLRFKTSKSGDKWVSLERYVENMADDQKFIYYITGPNIKTVEESPFLERLKKKDFEVLYMVEALDEYVTQALTEFDGNQLMSVSKEGLKLGDENKDKIKALEEEFSDFGDWLKGIYGNKVEKVTVSARLATSPCILVTGQYGWSANMERIMKAQTFADAEKAKYMMSKKTMEINPRHPLIRELKAKSEEDEENAATIDLAELLYDAALVSSGFTMTDTKIFAERIHRVLGQSLDIDPNEEIPDEEDEEEEEEEEEEEDEEEEEAELEDDEEAEEAPKHEDL